VVEDMEGISVVVGVAKMEGGSVGVEDMAKMVGFSVVVGAAKMEGILVGVEEMEDISVVVGVAKMEGGSVGVEDMAKMEGISVVVGVAKMEGGSVGVEELNILLRYAINIFEIVFEFEIKGIFNLAVEMVILQTMKIVIRITFIMQVVLNTEMVFCLFKKIQKVSCCCYCSRMNQNKTIVGSACFFLLQPIFSIVRFAIRMRMRKFFSKNVEG
jgi:hypothetical protein